MCRPPINDILDNVEKHFPGATKGSETLQAVKPVVEKLGLTPENTLFAQSICPDEINHEPGDIPNLFADYLGEVFHLGGLGGIPFSGKTGFGAFTSHVPDGGHCFILMAPHIGLSNAGKLGQYTRDGQKCSGSACGAAVGALKHCCAGKELPDMATNADDQQMAYIIHQVNQRKDEILASGATNENAKQANLVKANYTIAQEMLDKITNLKFGDENSTLTILTGIQINMPRPFEDYFQPLSFTIQYKDGTTKDLFDETFNKEFESDVAEVFV